MPAEIDPISGTKMFPQFQNPVANRFAITEHPCFQSFQSNSDFRLRLLVPQGLQPAGDRFTATGSPVSKDFNHDANVA